METNQQRTIHYPQQQQSRNGNRKTPWALAYATCIHMKQAMGLIEANSLYYLIILLDSGLTAKGDERLPL